MNYCRCGISSFGQEDSVPLSNSFPLMLLFLFTFALTSFFFISPNHR